MWKKLRPVPEHLGLVVALHAEALAGVQPPQPLLETM